MVLVKNLRTSSEQSQACCPTEHKNKASRLEISEIIRTEHQCLKDKICSAQHKICSAQKLFDNYPFTALFVVINKL